MDELSNTQSTTVINLTKAHFARHGVPVRCLTDNGPQFTSIEYKHFAQTYGFEYITSSSYWFRSNGKAEAAVSDAKAIIKKSDDIYLALLNIRNTPHLLNCTTPHGETHSLHNSNARRFAHFRIA